MPPVSTPVKQAAANAAASSPPKSPPTAAKQVNVPSRAQLEQELADAQAALEQAQADANGGLPSVGDSWPDGEDQLDGGGRGEDGETDALGNVVAPEHAPYVPHTKEVYYPDLVMVPCFSGRVTVHASRPTDDGGGFEDDVTETWGNGPITEEMAKDWLGWETEAEFKVRKMAEDPTLKEERVANFGDYGPLLKDFDGNFIQCWNNTLNRPFVRKGCDRYRQDILQRNWAGPLTISGETVNCESIILGRSKEVISGQKRLIALVLACQMWRKQPIWHRPEYWPDGPPVLESVVWFGCSEHPRVVQTIDNVDPRKESDVMYTTNQFPEITQPTERKNINAYLANAVKLLWEHTGITAIDQHSKQRTLSMSLEFLSRHESLKECVRLMHKLNQNRAVCTKLEISCGDAAGLMYLMAASLTDRDKYKNAEPKPNEAAINFKNWKKAEEFWKRAVNLNAGKANAADKDGQFRALRGQLDADGKVLYQGAIRMSADVSSSKINSTLLFEVLARAWEQFIAGETLDREFLRIKHLATDNDGMVTNLEESDFMRSKTGNGYVLADPHTFGGIDVGKRAVEAPKNLDDADEEGGDGGTSAEDRERSKKAAENLKDLEAKFNSARKPGVPAVAEQQVGQAPTNGGKRPTGAGFEEVAAKAEKAAAERAAKQANTKPADKPAVGGKSGKQPLRGGIG